MPGPEADPDPAAHAGLPAVDGRVEAVVGGTRTEPAAGATDLAGVHALRDPRAVHELFLFRLTLLANTARIPVVRLCQREHGITRREFRLLGALAGSAGISSSALAARMRLDRARTSRVVTSLVAKGLVQREVTPADRRETLLQLSPRGQTTFDELLPRVAAINRELLAGLNDAELAVIDLALRHLTDTARTMGAGVAGTGAAEVDEADGDGED